MSEELKPCPFCGKENPEIVSHKFYPLRPPERFGVSCCVFFFDCREKSKEKAIAAWNCRSDASLRASEEKLAVAVDAFQKIAAWAKERKTWGISLDNIEVEASIQSRNLISNPALLQLAEAREKVVELTRLVVEHNRLGLGAQRLVAALAAYDAARKAVTDKK